MLSPRFHPIPTFAGLAASHSLVTFINVNCGLYRIFPQEVFFLLTSTGMIFLFYLGKGGKKVMISLFMDGLGYTSCFVFLPLIDYAAGRVKDHLLSGRLYGLCDILTLVWNQPD